MLVALKIGVAPSLRESVIVVVPSPAPIIEMDRDGIVTSLDHEHDPAGMFTVLPLVALFTAACTSAALHDAALIMLPLCTGVGEGDGLTVLVGEGEGEGEGEGLTV